MPKRSPLPVERDLFLPDYEPRRSRPLRQRRRPARRRLVRTVACWGAFLIALALSTQMGRHSPARAATGSTLVRAAASHRPSARVSGWRGELSAAVRRSTRSAAPKRSRTGARKAVRKKPRGNWVQVWATAYCPTCEVCDTGKITASGRHAFSRGLAVAARGRRVAPLGSRIYVPRFGWLRVDDTGGGVRSDQIDIRMQSHRRAVQWGRRRLLVQVARR